MRARTSARYSFMASTDSTCASSVSQCRAASARPGPEPPAWQTTGLPWGGARVFRGPRLLCHFPWKSTGRTFDPST